MNLFKSKPKALASSAPTKNNLSYNFKNSSQNSETKHLIPPESSKSTKLFSNYFNKFTDQVGQKISNMGAKTQEVSNTFTNWKYFVGFFIAGLLMIALSVPYLSILVLAPQKFAGLFTLGSISILVSLGILKGPYNFLMSFLKKEKIMFSVVYLVSLLGTFYVAVIQKSYIMVMLFSFIQIFSLAWLMSTNFPGGAQTMKFITNRLVSCVKGCFGQLLGGTKQKSSFLPI